MKIIVLSCDPQFNLNLTDVLTPYRVFPKLNLEIINVVEPSLVVDMSLSLAGGRSIFRHIMEQRMIYAEQSALMAETILSSYASLNVSAQAIFGVLNIIAINSAIKNDADLLIVDARNLSPGKIDRLIKNCPCPVTLIGNPRKKSA